MTETNPGSPRLDQESVRIGATIKALRESRGLSQEQLATKSLLSRPYLANIETGRKKPSVKAIARIARALQVPQISLMVVPEDVAA